MVVNINLSFSTCVKTASRYGRSLFEQSRVVIESFQEELECVQPHGSQVFVILANVGNPTVVDRSSTIIGSFLPLFVTEISWFL